MCLLNFLKIVNESIAKCLKSFFISINYFRRAGLKNYFPYDIFVIFPPSPTPRTHMLGNTYSLDIRLYKSGFFISFNNLASTFCSSLVFALPLKFLLVFRVWFPPFSLLPLGWS